MAGRLGGQAGRGFQAAGGGWPSWKEGQETWGTSRNGREERAGILAARVSRQAIASLHRLDPPIARLRIYACPSIPHAPTLYPHCPSPRTTMTRPPFSRPLNSPPSARCGCFPLVRYAVRQSYYYFAQPCPPGARCGCPRPPTCTPLIQQPPSPITIQHPSSSPASLPGARCGCRRPPTCTPTPPATCATWGPTCGSSTTWAPWTGRAARWGSAGSTRRASCSCEEGGAWGKEGTGGKGGKNAVLFYESRGGFWGEREEASRSEGRS